MLELSVPVNVTPIIQFFKQIGEHQKKRLARKSKEVRGCKNTVDSFYVLYVLTTGIIDDVAPLIKFITENDW